MNKDFGLHIGIWIIVTAVHVYEGNEILMLNWLKFLTFVRLIDPVIVVLIL
jgi:hypothetical protein